MRFIVIMMLSILSACGTAPSSGGDGGAAPTEQQQTQPTDSPAPVVEDSKPEDEAKPELERHSFLVADAASLPKCDAAGEGWLVYVTADKTFKTCTAGAWANVEIKGEKGADGKDGKDGTDNRIVKSISCYGEIGTTGLYAGYSVALMASGDVFATAEVSNDLDQSSATAFYSSKQNGSTNASVLITKDEAGSATSGFWNVTLDRESLVTTINYHDAEFDPADALYTMTPDKCTVNDY